MFTYTTAHDIEWAYEPFETVGEAMDAGEEYFGKGIQILIGEIGEDNKVTPIEQIELEYKNAQEWGEIHHSELGWIMTYYPIGVPAFDSWTKPFVDNEGDICCYRYDHDEGVWHEDIIVVLGEYTGEKLIYL